MVLSVPILKHVSSNVIKIYFNLIYLLVLYLPETEIAEFANSTDLDEVAHNEPPHPDLLCLPSSL